MWENYRDMPPYQTAEKKFDGMCQLHCTGLDTIPQRDGQTDRNGVTISRRSGRARWRAIKVFTMWIGSLTDKSLWGPVVRRSERRSVCWPAASQWPERTDEQCDRRPLPTGLITDGNNDKFTIRQWVSECGLTPHQHITVHFGDESFQSVTCTGK